MKPRVSFYKIKVNILQFYTLPDTDLYTLSFIDNINILISNLVLAFQRKRAILIYSKIYNLKMKVKFIKVFTHKNAFITLTLVLHEELAY